MSRVTGNAHALQVMISDGRAPQYFSQFVINSQTITKSAVAEYVLPLPLGSPKNTFGSGDIQTGANAENFWAAVEYATDRTTWSAMITGNPVHLVS